MKHIFDIDVATEYGLNAAILLENFWYWISKNEANRINFHDGFYWTFNSINAFKELFPYMGEKQIRNAIQKLIDSGLIVTGNYNQSEYDRTIWYAITQKGKCICQNGKMDLAKRANGFSQKGEPIPNINTDINTDNKLPLYNPPQKEDDFDVFWRAYPKKVGKGAAKKAFEKTKGVKLQTLLDAIEKQKRSAQWKQDGGQYIPMPSTWLNQERWDDELPEDERSDMQSVKRVSANTGLYDDEYVAELASKIKYDN